MKTKKFLSMMIVISLIITMCTGCGKKESEDIKTSDIEAAEVLAHIKTEVPIDGDFLCYLSCFDNWKDFAGAYYRFDDETINSITSFAMVSPISVSANEYVIIKTTNVDAVKSALENYRTIRIGDFTGYAPDEEAKLSDCETVVCGDYVALLVHEDSDAAIKEFKAAVAEGFEPSPKDRRTAELLMNKAAEINDASTEEPTTDDTTDTTDTTEEPSDGTPRRKTLPDGTVLVEELPGVIEPYDTTHIIEAYKAGDKSLLTDPNDIAVYDEMSRIIETYINPYMTEYEKEKTIHDYLVENTSYDQNCLTYSNWYSEYADQPYGCLIDHRSICLGYASTFKLFMDAIGIECVIVKGSANMDYANHAWNLVKLEDGNWYAVDVTWDDPVGNYLIFYTYFNVDDQKMIGSNHHWDVNEYPSATGGEFSGLEDEEN